MTNGRQLKLDFTGSRFTVLSNILHHLYTLSGILMLPNYQWTNCVFLRKCTQCANLVHCCSDIQYIQHSHHESIPPNLCICFVKTFLFVRVSFPMCLRNRTFQINLETQNVKQISEKLLLLNLQKELPNPVCPTSVSTKCSHSPPFFIPSLQRFLDPYCPLTKMENYCKTKTHMKFESGRQKAIFLEDTRHLTTPSVASLDLLKHLF